MRTILSIAGKDLRLMLRDKVGFFFTFGFPLLYAIFFGLIFAGAGESGSAALPVVVVDEDGTEKSRAFVEKLARGPELKVTRAPRAEAVAQVRRGKQTAFVVLPAGFGKSRERMFWGEPVRIEVGVDPARKAEAGFIQGALTSALYEGVQDAFSNPDAMRRNAREAREALQRDSSRPEDQRERLGRFLGELDRFYDAAPGGGERAPAWRPFTINVSDVRAERAGPKNTFDVTFPQGIIWGIMACAAAFGISLVVERAKGTLVRLRLSPAGRVQILAGKGAACLATTLGMSAVLLTIAIVGFKVRPVSYPLLGVALVSIALCFVGIMMLLATVGRTEAAASGIGWAILTLMAMIGGGMVPLFLMPAWLQVASSVSPVKWSILAMEGAVWRGFTPAEMALPCGILVAIGAAAFALGVRMFRWGEADGR